MVFMSILDFVSEKCQIIPTSKGETSIDIACRRSGPIIIDLPLAFGMHIIYLQLLWYMQDISDFRVQGRGEIGRHWKRLRQTPKRNTELHNNLDGQILVYQDLLIQNNNGIRTYLN